MTAMPDTEFAQNAAQKAGSRGIEVTARSFGYVIKSDDKMSFPLLIAQLCAGVAGVAGMLLAFGMWFLPGLIASAGIMGMQIGASVAIVAVSSFFLWYASRGLEVLIEVDLNQGEVRETTVNRIGRRSVFSRYGFDSIASVVVLPEARPGTARVMLAGPNRVAFLPVATGPGVEAASLAARLRTDLLLGPELAERTERPRLIDLDAAA